MPGRRLAEAADTTVAQTQRKFLYGIPDMVRGLGMCRTTIYEEIAAGRLQTVRAGRRRFATESQLAAYVALLEAEALDREKGPARSVVGASPAAPALDLSHNCHTPPLL